MVSEKTAHNIINWTRIVRGSEEIIATIEKDIANGDGRTYSIGDACVFGAGVHISGKTAKVALAAVISEGQKALEKLNLEAAAEAKTDQERIEK